MGRERWKAEHVTGHLSSWESEIALSADKSTNKSLFNGTR